MEIEKFVIFAIISYLLGAIPFGLIISKLIGRIDITQYGSGNVGTANVTRTLGAKAGVLVMIFDLMKAVVAVLLANFIIGNKIMLLASLPATFQGQLAQVVAATMAMLGTIVLATPAAYVIARLPKLIAYAIIIVLLLSRMVPEVSVALSIAINFLKVGLLDTHVGLALAHMIRTLPLATWILVGTFRTIPGELEEASQVDGCSRWQTLRWVVLPLAAPGLAVCAIFAWLESWNEFTYALYLTISENTLPLQTYYYLNRGSIFNSAAYATIITIPVIIITFILQRYLKAGMLAGGVK